MWNSYIIRWYILCALIFVLVSSSLCMEYVNTVSSDASNSSSKSTECECGSNGKCSISPSNGIKLCECNVGYQEYQGICKNCDCGDHAQCSFDDNGYIKCRCDNGYAELSGNCMRCDCGENADCLYHFHRKIKICTCQFGYVEYNETCKRCECGAHSICSFKDGSQTCSCDPGFKDINGTCQSETEECNLNCYPGQCIREKLRNEENCFCPEHYISQNGSCRVLKHRECKSLDCSPGVCAVEDYNEFCLCPKNYRSTLTKCIRDSFQESDGQSNNLLFIVAIAVGATSLICVVFSLCACVILRKKKKFFV